MILKRHIAPEIGQNIILRGIEVIGSRGNGPFLTQNVAVGIFHLIEIGERHEGMLSRLKGRGLQFPLPTVAGEHHLTTRALRPVKAAIGDIHKEVLAPFCAVVNSKLQFHKPYFHAKIQIIAN